MPMLLQVSLSSLITRLNAGLSSQTPSAPQQAGSESWVDMLSTEELHERPSVSQSPPITTDNPPTFGDLAGLAKSTQHVSGSPPSPIPPRPPTLTNMADFQEEPTAAAVPISARPPNTLTNMAESEAGLPPKPPIPSPFLNQTSTSITQAALSTSHSTDQTMPASSPSSHSTDQTKAALSTSPSTDKTQPVNVPSPSTVKTQAVAQQRGSLPDTSSKDLLPGGSPPAAPLSR